MTPNVSSQIMVLLSMAYGVTCAVLGLLGADAVGVFAPVGGMALGVLWVARSLFVKRPGGR